MKKVLVVDNHIVTLKYLETLLGKEGFEVRTAEDGIIALDIIKDFEPDIIFVDLVMPYIRGDKLVSILRGIESIKYSKIVVLSGIAAEIESDHVKYGADACIAKGPFNKMGNHILELVKAFKRGQITEPVRDVIGTEDVFKRAITTELIASRRHTDLIMDSISDGIVELNKNLRIVYANKAAREILGVKESELITSRFEDHCMVGNAEEVKDYFLSIKDGENSEPVVVARDSLFFEINARHLITENDESYIVIIRDVTFFKKKLIEKERMIREIYHRIKNNLAIISSIINLQIGDSSDERVHEALFDLKNRLDSITMVHSKIYKSDDPDTLPLKDYMEDIFTSMITSGIQKSGRVSFDINLPDVKIGISTAVSLGLVITELVSNSLKYGIRDNQEGRISLSGTVEGDSLKLVFSDNGSAPDNFFSFDHSDSLSLRLVQALTSQMGSDIKFEKKGGASYTFTVPLSLQ